MEEKIDLGLPGANWENRVVVAMSGGVDSSVTAALVAEAGYEVVGITLQLYDHGSAIQRKGACCAGADIHDARLVAEKIGIPHYVLDYESKFRESVMEEFADSYARGETPIPCIRCNQTVKFRDLLQTAKQLGAKALCTDIMSNALSENLVSNYVRGSIRKRIRVISFLLQRQISWNIFGFRSAGSRKMRQDGMQIEWDLMLLINQIVRTYASFPMENMQMSSAV